MSTWTPGQRKQQLALETPFEGVPTHLKSPLWELIWPSLANSSSLTTAVGLEFRLALPPRSVSHGSGAQVNSLRDHCFADDATFLNLVEYLLERKAVSRTQVDKLLSMANSAYKVREDGMGLEMRTTPEVQTQVQKVVHTSAAAGVHLAQAWNAAYSLSPDPVKSYSESIKAVETALVDKISPNNTKATLGTMIADLNNKPAKWKFVIPDGTHSKGVETIVGMMQVLWQRNARHGGPNHKPETLDEAQAAVHLAASLVQFGVSGAFDLA